MEITEPSSINLRDDPEVVRELLKRHSGAFYSQKVMEFEEYLNYQLSSLGYDHSSLRRYDEIMLFAQASMQALHFKDKPVSFGAADAGFMAFSDLSREVVNAVERAANTHIIDEQHAIRVAQFEGFNVFAFRNALIENMAMKIINREVERILREFHDQCGSDYAGSLRIISVLEKMFPHLKNAKLRPEYIANVLQSIAHQVEEFIKRFGNSSQSPLNGDSKKDLWDLLF